MIDITDRDLPKWRPPRPRYEGPMTIIGLDLEEPMNDLQREVWMNAPYNEDWPTSLRRLINALRHDGECEIRISTVWKMYRKYPELCKEQKPNGL